MATQPTNALAIQKGAAVKTIEKILELKKGDIINALPKHIRYENWTRVALTTFANDSKLFECDPMTVGIALMEAAQLGLVIEGVRGEGYLVPFWNSKQKRLDAKFMPGYRGYIKLAIQTGRVIQVRANAVYEGDYFIYEEGLGARLEHRPASPDKRGDFTGAYAICELKETPRDQNPFKFMWAEEIEDIRKRSPNGSDEQGNPKGVWKSDYVEMSKKTCVRALAKYLNLSPELTRAAVMDEYTEAGVVIDSESGEIVSEPDHNSQRAATGYDKQAVALKEKLAAKKESMSGTPEVEASDPRLEAKEPELMTHPDTQELYSIGTITKVFPATKSGKGKRMSIKMGSIEFSTFSESLQEKLASAEGKDATIIYTVTQKDGKEYKNVARIQKLGGVEFDTDGTPIMSSDQAAEYSAKGVEGVFAK